MDDDTNGWNLHPHPQGSVSCPLHYCTDLFNSLPTITRTVPLRRHDNFALPCTLWGSNRSGGLPARWSLVYQFCTALVYLFLYLISSVGIITWLPPGRAKNRSSERQIFLFTNPEWLRGPIHPPSRVTSGVSFAGNRADGGVNDHSPLSCKRDN